MCPGVGAHSSRNRRAGFYTRPDIIKERGQVWKPALRFALPQ